MLPLGSGTHWDDGHAPHQPAGHRLPSLIGSDGYSQSKADAEALVWRAAAQGLRVTVTRVPHLIAPHSTGRLRDTLDVLVHLDCLPEGDWQWQAAPLSAVCDHLLRCLRGDRGNGPLYHVAAPALSRSRVAAALADRGRPLRSLSLPALANVLRAALDEAPSGTEGRHLTTLNQLTREHGIRSAFCLNEPLLATHDPQPLDPDDLLDMLLADLPTRDKRVGAASRPRWR